MAKRKRRTREQKAKVHINNVVGGLRKRGATKAEAAAARRYIVGKFSSPSHVMCPWCVDELSGDYFSLDHLTPVSRGGGHGVKNLCLTCPRCNRVKGDMSWDEFCDLRHALANLGEVANSVYQRLAMSGYAYARRGRGR